MQAQMIEIDKIRRDPAHPRQNCDEDGIKGLAQSMAEVGILHPLLVRRGGEGSYILVAGERRLRAAQLRGESHVPAIILSDDAQVRQIQLVENLQREDLNPLERALAVKAFMEEQGLSKLAAAERLGVPRTTLTDWLDLLDVEPRFQRAVVDNYYGGDSCLTLSHIAEALGLARRLASPGLATVFLDACMQYRLSKVETRQVASLIRENPHVSLQDAVRTVRRLWPDAVDQRGEPDSAPDAATANLQRLMADLDRTAEQISRLQHVSHRFLTEDQRAALIERYERLQNLVREALTRMQPDWQPAGPAKTRRRGKGRRSSRAKTQAGARPAAPASDAEPVAAVAGAGGEG